MKSRAAFDHHRLPNPTSQHGRLAGGTVILRR